MRFPGNTGRFYNRQEGCTERGGQAEVFLALDDQGNRYAVKRALPGKIGDHWLSEEADHVQRLLEEHPDIEGHVVPIVDRAVVDGAVHLVMPWREHRLDKWIQGRSLLERLRVAEALAASVSRIQIGPEGVRSKLVHRDIKPSNAFVVEDGEELRVELADFGAARTRNQYTSHFVTGAYTRGFAPIDQQLSVKVRHLDPSWDVYATATTIYFILTDQTLQGVLESYTKKTLEGRALDQDRETYDLTPTRSTFERIRARSDLALVELVQLDQIKPVLQQDHEVLENRFRVALSRTGWSESYRERLVDHLTRELLEAMRLALVPDPGRRSPDARKLHQAVRTVRKQLKRTLAGEQVLYTSSRWTSAAMTLFPTAALIGGTLALVLPEANRNVRITVDGVPKYFEVRATLEGDGGTWSSDEGLAFSDVPPGRYTLTVRGSHDGRCPWEDKRQEIVVGWGIGALHQVVTPQGVSACPSAAHGYTDREIRAGTTTIGSVEGRDWYWEADEASREVTLTHGFVLGVTEVTQAMWRAVMGSNPVLTEQTRNEGGPTRCALHQGVESLVGDGLPVVCVTWCEAARFANRMSELEGLQPVYEGVETCETSGAIGWRRGANGWRLPTEAEWEHAARAGGQHRHIAGSLQTDSDRACKQISMYGNVADEAYVARFPDKAGGGRALDFYEGACQASALLHDGVVGLAPVGSYQPNAWQLFDMTGNVREWTFDVYDPAPSGLVDPAGPELGDFRTFRGSAYDDAAKELHLSNRGRAGRDQRMTYVGLRLARNGPAPVDEAMLSTRALRTSTVPGTDGDCGAFRLLLPPDQPCRVDTSATTGAYEASRTDDAFGIELRMEISRDGQPFRQVPLSTPVCDRDHVAFTFVPSEPGHIHVLNHGTSGTWTRIHPDPGEPSAFGPDTAARLPPRHDEGFPVTGPSGTEHVLFFVSASPRSEPLQRQLDELGLDAIDFDPLRQVVLLQDLRQSPTYVVGPPDQVIALELAHSDVCEPLP